MKSVFEFERLELAQSLTPPYRATQIFKAVYQRWLDDFEAITDLPKTARTELAEQWNLRLPETQRRFNSIDGTRRYLVRCSDGELAETVFIPETQRNTIC